MNERGVILDALTECKENIEYAERRLEEVGNSNRTIRKNLYNGIADTRVRVETIVEIAYALGIISEEESRMGLDTLIETIEDEG